MFMLATQYTRQGALGTGELVRVESWLMHGDLHFIATVKATSDIYAVAPVKISESPASNTAIVEHL